MYTVFFNISSLKEVFLLHVLENKISFSSTVEEVPLFLFAALMPGSRCHISSLNEKERGEVG